MTEPNSEEVKPVSEESVVAPEPETVPATPEAVTETEPAKPASKKWMLIALAFLLLLLILLFAFLALRPAQVPVNTSVTPTPTLAGPGETSTTPTQAGGASTTPTGTTGSTVSFSEDIHEVTGDRTTTIEGSYENSASAPVVKNLVDDEAGNGITFLSVKGEDFEINFIPRYEAEIISYGSQYAAVTGAKLTNLGRYYDQSQARWEYVISPVGSSCSYLGDTFQSPCGLNFAVSEDNGGAVNFIVEALCEGNVTKCDAVLKTVTIASK